MGADIIHRGHGLLTRLGEGLIAGRGDVLERGLQCISSFVHNGSPGWCLSVVDATDVPQCGRKHCVEIGCVPNFVSPINHNPEGTSNIFVHCTINFAKMPQCNKISIIIK
jgi:hypothetical protein